MVSKGLDFQSRVWKVNIQVCGAKFPNGPLGFIKLCFAEGLGFWGISLPEDDVVHRRRGREGFLLAIVRVAGYPAICPRDVD
jgi:hypothetical protein